MVTYPILFFVPALVWDSCAGTLVLAMQTYSCLKVIRSSRACAWEVSHRWNVLHLEVGVISVPVEDEGQRENVDTSTLSEVQGHCSLPVEAKRLTRYATETGKGKWIGKWGLGTPLPDQGMFGGYFSVSETGNCKGISLSILLL